MNKWIFIGALTALVSCQPIESSQHRFLFAGHTYDWQVETGDRIDPRLEAWAFQNYDGIWLGGDICARTTENPATLDYLEQVFPFSNQSVHWALGNHDVKFGYPEELESLRGHPRFYAQWMDGLVVLVLDTNFFQWPNARPDPDFCAQMAAQDALVHQVSDTLQKASHLIVLHHYNLVTQSISGGKVNPDTLVNYHKPFLKTVCRPDTATFSQRWWPLFQKIQARGVEVVFVCGDLGMQAKRLEVQTPEGIWFLGAALNNSVDSASAPSYVKDFSPDQMIEFEYERSEKELRWDFIQPLL
jgi:hypothetical protein